MKPHTDRLTVFRVINQLSIHHASMKALRHRRAQRKVVALMRPSLITETLGQNKRD